jgi:citrate lyase beta subunit
MVGEADALVLSAEDAVGRGAAEEAVALLEQALSLAGRADDALRTLLLV